MTEANFERFTRRVQERDSVDRVPIADKIEFRRKGLNAHNRKVIPAVAEVIGCMVDAARWGRIKIASLRCDRKRRLREFHFDATKPLPVEDLVAIALESEAGRTVATAGVRELARICGYALAPLDSKPATDLESEGLTLMERTVEAGAELVRDAKDNGQIDEPEKHMSRLHAIGDAVPRIVAGIKAAVAPRVEAYRAARVTR